MGRSYLAIFPTFQVTTTDHELKHWSGKHPVITSIVTFPLLILYAGMLLVGAGCVLVQNLWRPRA
jgi:hypothetical protein